jgi:meso-butanediol dehydrogenase/(S,S)-butanediol dehydrogenase/diacetyl reductase
MWKQVDEDLMALGVSSKPGEAMENFSADILLGRPGQPEEIAGTALFLASSDSDYITGQIMAVDGGMILV